MNVQPRNGKVDQIFEQYTKPGSPGCAMAVMKDGEIVYKQGYGLADLEHNLPILPATVFNIGSTTKQFTAFSIALLENQGKLLFEDDIRQHLPEMHDFGQAITIRHLLHHTSGIRCTFPDLLMLAEWRESDVTTQEDVFKLLQRQRELDFPPGTEFAYANSNYILLALICERASGQSFAPFCKDNIFEPLGMTRTVINDQYWKIIPGRARAYYDDGQDGWVNSLLSDSVIGPTNVYSTVEDMARWDENFYTAKAGGKAVIDLLDQPGQLNDGTILGYAFGLEAGAMNKHRGWRVVEHGGGQGGYCNHMVRFPELHLSVVVMFNNFLWGSRDYALRVADIFMEDNPDQEVILESKAVPVNAVEVGAEVLEAKVGKYFNSHRAALREITFKEGRLKFQGYDLVPINKNRFFIEVEPDVQIKFSSKIDGSQSQVKTITSSGEFVYDYVEGVSPTKNEFASYAGIYYSPELDIYWTIEALEDHLVAKRRKYAESKMVPVFNDAFSDDWLPITDFQLNLLVVFERDAQSNINGMRVSGIRVRNIRFVKVAKEVAQLRSS